MTERADLADSGHLLPARAPDGKGKAPGQVAYEGYATAWNPHGPTPWSEIECPTTIAAWAAVETAVLSHYAPSYTDDDHRRLHAQLVDTQRQLDEARAALREIRDAWTARARMPDEDGVQALKDIARDALKAATTTHIPTGTLDHMLSEIEKARSQSSDAAITTEAAGRVTFDLIAHLERQRTWSRETFGPGARTAGVIDHIRKELREIEADPSDITEWVDVIILAFDGSWRAGWDPRDIVKAIVAKQTKNEDRTWPDWRTADPNKAIERDRSEEAALPHMPAGRVVPAEQRFTVETIEGAIGGSYEMPDGRKFWIDGPVAREMARRVLTPAPSEKGGR